MYDGWRAAMAAAPNGSVYALCIADMRTIATTSEPIPVHVPVSDLLTVGALAVHIRAVLPHCTALHGFTVGTIRYDASHSDKAIPGRPAYIMIADGDTA